MEKKELKELKDDIFARLEDISLVEQSGHPFCFKKSRCEWNTALIQAKKEVREAIKCFSK